MKLFQYITMQVISFRIPDPMRGSFNKQTMKGQVINMLCLAISSVLLSWKASDSGTLVAAGTQPQLSVDPMGVIRMVFGRTDSIFCATTTNNGHSFAAPVLVGTLTGMHLGMSRGPQIASSLHASIITAVDKAGNIHFFQMENKTGKWQRKGYVNDLRSSAPEGLMGLAADYADHFYAVWLDTRKEKKNNIAFSSYTLTQSNWSANTLLYQSPDGHVCECCKPNIAVQNGKIAILFRNWLSGSRDLYLLQSGNSGQTFTAAEKLGKGTWPLNGCPMDGGGLVFNHNGSIQTTWQRNGVIYSCRPGEPEIQLAKGRGCSIANGLESNEWIISYQDGENARLINTSGRELAVVKGSYLKPMVMGKGKFLCVWESHHSIFCKQAVDN